MKKPSTLKKFARGFGEIHRMTPSLLPLTVVLSVSQAILPFVNLYFSARIIDSLTAGADKRSFISLVCTALALNFILFVLGRTLETKTDMARLLMFNKERGKITSTLYSMDYENLENPTFQALVHKHEESSDKNGSPLFRLSWMLREWVKGGVTLLFAVVLMIPLLKISFQGGDTFIESPWFAAVLFAGIAAAVGVILVTSKKLNKQWFQWEEEFMGISKIFSFYRNLITDYKTGKEIRTYQEQDLIEEDATRHLITRGFHIQQKIAANSARTSSLIAIIGAVLGFGIYLFIGLKGLIGLFTIGSVVKFTGSFMQIIQGVTSIAVTIGQASMLIPTLDYYFDLIHTEPVKKSGHTLPAAQRLEIEFKHVSFRYPGAGSYALKNFSMKLGHGEHLAVVGRNGSGKTTFIKLLCRMYDPQEGQILLNGVDISTYDEKEYRKLFSVVFQDFSVFSFTLGQNIAGAQEFDAARVWECLEEAGMAERARAMPKGLDTYLYKDLEEKGVEISGGEAQKLALARALYKNAPVIVLDEPTAALDPIAEYEVYEKFNGFVQNKTAVYISHRLSSCRFCEHIAVFHKGRLEQYGTHDTLIDDPAGAYFDLWNAQAQYYV